jgi:hypothetical protein
MASTNSCGNAIEVISDLNTASETMTSQFICMARQLEQMMIEHQSKIEAALAEALSREAAQAKRVEELTEENVFLKSTITTYRDDFEAERAARTVLAGKLEDMRNELSGCHVYRPVTMFRPNLVHGRDETDLIETYVPDCEPDSARDEDAASGDEKLRCPKCKKDFDLEDHFALVDHMDECA